MLDKEDSVRKKGFFLSKVDNFYELFFVCLVIRDSTDEVVLFQLLCEIEC